MWPVDVAAYVSAASATAQAIFSGVQTWRQGQSRDRPAVEGPRSHQTAGRWLPAIIAVCAAFWVTYDNHFNRLADYDRAVLQYSYIPLMAVASEVVDTGKLTDFSDSYRLVLLGQIIYGDVDSVTDTGIAKSVPYTITGNMINLEFAVDYTTKLRLKSNGPNRLQLSLILVPKAVSVDQITSLESLRSVGAKVLSQRGLNMGPIPFMQPHQAE